MTSEKEWNLYCQFWSCFQIAFDQSHCNLFLLCVQVIRSFINKNYHPIKVYSFVFIMNNSEDFFQVNCEVPFKPIHQITIESINLQEHQMIIRAKVVLKGEGDSEFIQLVRTEKDLKWLIENLLNSGNCPIHIQTDPCDTLTELLSLFSTPQPIHVKKTRCLKQRAIERCLNLVTTIILEHFKDRNEQYHMPIFIFFHQNFLLYQNPIYYKQNKSSLSNKMGSYFRQKFAQITGKGNHWLDLQIAKNSIIQQRNRIQSVSSKLFDYINQLYKLQQQFISQKQKIRKRITKTQELHLNFYMQLRYLDMIIQEIKETATRAEEKKQQVTQLIKGYTQTIRYQAIQAAKVDKKLLSDYVKVICNEEQKLKIGPL